MKNLTSLLFLFIVTMSAAQTKIAVDSQCTDQAGAAFGFAIKDAVRGSNSYTLADGGLSLQMTCLDASTFQAGSVTAASIVVTLEFKDGSCYIVYHGIAIVGRDRVKDQALLLLSRIDKRWTDLLAEWSKGTHLETN